MGIADERFMRILLTVVMAAACLAGEPEKAALPRHVLTNDGLVVLAEAGLGEALLVDLVKAKRTAFDTSAEALAVLARRGISEGVIRAVVEKQEQVQLGRAARAEPSDIVLLNPAQGKREPDRWYRVTLR